MCTLKWSIGLKSLECTLHPNVRMMIIYSKSIVVFIILIEGFQNALYHYKRCYGLKSLECILHPNVRMMIIYSKSIVVFIILIEGFQNALYMLYIG